jgi:hypothetical protein
MDLSKSASNQPPSTFFVSETAREVGERRVEAKFCFSKRRERTSERKRSVFGRRGGRWIKKGGGVILDEMYRDEANTYLRR